MSVNRLVGNRLKGCNIACSIAGSEGKGGCINKRLQINSALISGGAMLVVSMFFGLLLVGVYYYFSLSTEFLMAEMQLGMMWPLSPSQGSQFISTSREAYGIATRDSKIVLLRLVVIGLTLSFGAGYLEMRRMHRIAEPAHRICEYLQLATKGDYTVRIEARKNDHHRGMAESFNGLMARLGEKTVGKFK